MSTTPIPPPVHTLIEDMLAILIGTLFVSFGIAMFKQAGFLTGSTAGFAFLIHYLTALPFGPLFFVINLPFYYFAFRRMGWRFTAKSFCAVALVSVMSELHRYFINLAGVEPFYAAVFGGLLMGGRFHCPVPPSGEPRRRKHPRALSAGQARYPRRQAADGHRRLHPAGVVFCGQSAGAVGVGDRSRRA